jgi:hypothetical protein
MALAGKLANGDVAPLGTGFPVRNSDSEASAIAPHESPIVINVNLMGHFVDNELFKG